MEEAWYLILKSKYGFFQCFSGNEKDVLNKKIEIIEINSDYWDIILVISKDNLFSLFKELLNCQQISSTGFVKSK